MSELVVVILLVLAIANASRLGTVRRIVSRERGKPWVAVAGGLIAWAVVGFAAWAVYEGYILLEDVFRAPVTFMAAVYFVKFLAIIMGIAYLHQLVIQLAEAGSTEVLYRRFLRMLLFQQPYLKRTDAFEEAQRRRRSPGEPPGGTANQHHRSEK